MVLIKFKFLETLVQKLEQDQNTIGIDQKLGEVYELVDAVCFEMLEHVNEVVGNYHGRDDTVSIVLIFVLVHVEQILVFQRLFRHLNLFLLFFLFSIIGLLNNRLLALLP